MGRKGRKKQLTASNADRHLLYQESVQETSADIGLIDRAYRRRHGRPAKTLREDFCGTAAMCADWVRTRKDRTALGVDLDADTLEWGRRHNVEPLGAAAQRVKLIQANVLEVTEPRFDAVAAFNFSYCVFRKRRELLRYFQVARAALEPGGVFVLDNHSGSDVYEVTRDKRKCEGFTYIWEQEPVDGLDHHGIRRIHYRFPDGSQIRNAFVYDWRIWSLAELRDVAEDAGFQETEVYTEHFDEDGEPTTGLRKVRRYDHERSWTPYLVCWK